MLNAVKSRRQRLPSLSSTSDSEKAQSLERFYLTDSEPQQGTLKKKTDEPHVAPRKKRKSARNGYRASASELNKTFGEEKSPLELRTLRFKTIRPVFETLTINEKVPDYITPEMRLTSPASIWWIFRNFLGKETKEWFLSLHLDTKNRILATDVCSIGSLNQSIVNPREIMKSALLSSAAGLIFVHNHPSGDPTPSREDINITNTLKRAACLIGINLLDHIVITETDFVSFVNKGLL